MVGGTIGQPISKVIELWGAPTSITPDGQGGSIYTWEGWEPSGEFTSYNWADSFWVDANGIIYKWQ